MTWTKVMGVKSMEFCVMCKTSCACALYMCARCTAKVTTWSRRYRCASFQRLGFQLTVTEAGRRLEGISSTKSFAGRCSPGKSISDIVAEMKVAHL